MLHQNIKINAGIMGIAIVAYLSAFIPALLSAAKEIPWAIPINVYADAATCWPRRPVYLAAITEAEMAKALPTW